jgi:dipeptidyl aminopeptidase/acylaminoacyl peptidase
MESDIRESPLYREIEAFYRAALEPGSGRLQGLDHPEPSPDGSEIAFVGSTLDELEGHPSGRICLAAADGSGWRRITDGPNDDAEPRWSPDGRTLTFRSDRASKGRHQLYALHRDRMGEAEPLATIPGVVEHHRWSADGTRILLVVAGERAEQADALGSGTLAEAAGRPAWLPEVESVDAEDEWRTLWVLDVAGGEVRRVSRPGLNVWEATWLGDDTAAAIVSEAPGEGAWYTSPLAVIDLASGDERIVRRSDVQLGYAEGSPDGTTIAVIEAVCSDRYLVAGDLLLVDAATGGARAVDGVGGDALWLRWDAGRLVASALDGMEGVIADVDVETATATERWRSPAGGTGLGVTGVPIARGGFATTRAASATPPELLVVDGDVERVLVSVGHAGHETLLPYLGRSEVIRWTAPDGLEIEGLLRTPPGDGPFPLLLDVHGGPIWAETDQWPGVSGFLLLARGYATLAPNPRGSIGRGRDFAAAVVGDMGGADALDDLAGVDLLVERGIADPDRIGVIGGSYGGFMAAWLPAIDDRFKVAVSISPVTDWYSEHFNSSLIDWVASFLGGEAPEDPGGQHHTRSPVFAGRRLRTPTLLTAGAKDRATPPGQAVEMYRALRVQGVPAELAVYPAEGHGVRNFPAVIDVETRIVEWIERFMPAR